MPARLVALDEGPDIPLDRAMVVVGRHPQCDARIDSLRVSRHHCCMMQDQGEVVVRDLGSTNGIRINGQRVEMGRLRPGDELSIAHIRFRLDTGAGQDPTLADSSGFSRGSEPLPAPLEPPQLTGACAENPLAAAVRELLPSGVADRCRIRVIVEMQRDQDAGEAEKLDACRPNSSP